MTGNLLPLQGKIFIAILQTDELFINFLKSSLNLPNWELFLDGISTNSRKIYPCIILYKNLNIPRKNVVSIVVHCDELDLEVSDAGSQLIMCDFSKYNVFDIEYQMNTKRN